MSLFSSPHSPPQLFSPPHSLPRTPRIYSNKENAPSPASASSVPRRMPATASAPGKPRVGGIGRAPKRPRPAVAAKPYDRSNLHAQPRARQSSVARAKARTTGPSSAVKMEPARTPEPGLSAINPFVGEFFKPDPAARIVRPTDWTVEVPAAPVGYGLHPVQHVSYVQKHIRAQSKNGQHPMTGMAMAHVPHLLPRPLIPPIIALPGDLAKTNALYALKTLNPGLQRTLLLVSQAYRPAGEISRNGEYMPFTLAEHLAGVPTISEGVVGVQPDIVLYVKDCMNMHLPPKIIPARSLMYDVQCVGWAPTAKACHDAAYHADASATFDPSLYKSITSRSPIKQERPGRAPTAPIGTAASSSTSGSSSTTAAPVQVKLESIDEAAEDEQATTSEAEVDASMSSFASSTPSVKDEYDSDSESNADSDFDPQKAVDYDSDWRPEYPTDAFASATSSSAASSSTSASASTSSFPSTQEAIPRNADPTKLNLRVEHLYVPHGDTFPMLHVHLHQPETPLFPVLLGLPLYINSVHSPACAPILAAMPTADIMAKFERIRGFWSNVCALGVSADRTWNGMGEAWAALSGEMRRRAEAGQQQQQQQA